MKNTYFSNCFLEAKKAEKHGCKIIRLGSLYTGKILPHFFWYDKEKDAYFDFHKVKSTSNSLFYKGYIRELPRKDFARHVNRWISNNISKIENDTNVPIFQNSLDGGTRLFSREFFFEKEKSISGKIMYAENKNGKTVWNVEKIDNLNPIDDGGFITLKKLADNENIIGWMYWNVD